MRTSTIVNTNMGYITRKRLIEELWSVMAVSERYTDCDACAYINEKVSKLLSSETKPITK